jgi:hypothetical protein
VQRLQASVRKVQARLGQLVAQDAQPAAAETNPERSTGARAKRRPAVTRDTLLAELQTLTPQLDQAQSRLHELPARVPLSSLAKPREMIHLEPKLVTEAVKVAAYNAQAWLADRLVCHYPHPGDLHDLLRSFAQLPGTVTRQPDGTLRIRLDPPDIPLCARALQGLCDDLNQLQPLFPGTHIPILYEVAMHHLRKAA